MRALSNGSGRQSRSGVELLAALAAKSLGFRAFAVTLTASLLAGCVDHVGQSRLRRDTQLVAYVGDRKVGFETISTERVGSSITDTYQSELSVGPGISIHGSLDTTETHQPLRSAASGRNFPWHSMVKPWLAGPPGAPASDQALFPISGPFPVGQQAALIRYWKATGRASVVPTVGGGTVTVSECGTAGLETAALSCFEVAGLVWGRSLLWLNQADDLKAAFVPTVVGNVEYLSEGALAQRNELLRVAARGGARLAREVQPLATAAAVPVALTNLQLVDLAQGRTIPKAAVILHGDRITAAGPAVNIRIPPRAKVIDLGGRTLLPGLWDSHAHLRHPSWGPAYLGAGVTTARDLGNEFDFVRELRDAARSGTSLSPRILLAGVIGNPSYSGTGAQTLEAGRAQVDRYHAAGFEAIKVWENVPREVLSAVVSRSHELGLEVTGHVPSGVTLRQAIEAGQDQVNHTSALLGALEGPDAFESPRALAEFLAEAGTVVEPNLVTLEILFHRLREQLVNLEPGAEEAPADIVGAYQALRGDPGDAAAGDVQFRLALEVVRELHRAGVPILAGSDQGIPGHSLIREIELYVLAGIPNVDAIRAATTVPARILKPAAAVGTITPGSLADLVIVDGDPLTDIGALRRTCAVITRGILFDAVALKRTAGFRVPSVPRPCIRTE